MKNVDRFSQHLGSWEGKTGFVSAEAEPAFYLFSAHQLGLVYRAPDESQHERSLPLGNIYPETWKAENRRKVICLLEKEAIF